MAAQVDQLGAAVAALAHAWAGAIPARAGLEEDPSSAVREMTDGGLVAVLGALGEVTKRVETLGAVVAGEIARRSPVEARSEGLAKRSGFASPVRMVAESRGGKVGRAVELQKVGEGTASRQSLTGELLPAAHPHVADALHAGRIGVDAAHMIIAMLDRVAPRANPIELEATETLLSRQAAEFPLAQLEKLVRYAEARLDPDGLEPKEEDQYASRSLVMREDRNGMLHLRGLFDPVSGAPIKLALQDYAESRMRAARGNNLPHGKQEDPPAPHGSECPAAAAGGPEDTVAAGNDRNSVASDPTGGAAATNGAAAAINDPNTAVNGPTAANGAIANGPNTAAAPPETRTIAQLQADALVDFIRHVRGCEDTGFSLPQTTMVVRMDLADLEGRAEGSGVATIDGITQPISAGAARRLAASADLIPAVFGTNSIPLDLGHRVRSFTRAQVLALGERDGGCAMCGTTYFVEAHHIKWWWRHQGRTDLSNGVLLCSRCHHLIHRDGWEVEVRGSPGQVWFLPPAHVDPDREPRRAAANPRSRAAPAA